MNKKTFGKKMVTVFSAIACLALAVLIWLLVEYEMGKQETALFLPLLSSFFRG